MKGEDDLDVKGIVLWAGLIVIGAVIFFISQKMKKQIEENGIETVGVISRIADTGQEDEISLEYYAKYLTEDGKEIEGLISNPGSGLFEGQQVRLKYHPKYKTNVRLVK